MSSRLFQEVREKRGLVYSIYAFNSAFRDAGLFGIYAGTGPTQIGELLPTIRDVLQDFPGSVNASEINRSKAQLKAGTLMALESTSARCEKLAQQMMIFGRPISAQETIEKVNAVTRDDIEGAASQLVKNTPTFAALGPGHDIRWL